MRKYILTFVLTIQVVCGFGQSTNPEIKTDLPTVIPPSPTVAALMKFEEVPVSNYTGVPDISIPLFSSPTLSDKVDIAISIKYHPSGVAVDERASDVGLGWSLFAGGTISRTVRGLPDEQLIMGAGQSPGKVGLYHTSINSHNNYYYQHQNDLAAFVANNPYVANEYYWDITERGKYDTEHDLWQFNFMGKSGRFMIQKNLTTGVLEIVPLDDYRVTIKNFYQSNGNNPYIPQSFIIYDENGLKYVFDVIESTTNRTGVMNVYPITSNDSATAEQEFISSFQLTKVFDNNGNLIIEIDYINNPNYQEGFTNTVHTYNNYLPELIQYSIAGNCFKEFRPLYTRTNSITNVRVKKINFIDIKNYGKINFNYIQGRQDSNFLFPDKALRLNSIEVTNNSSVVKKFKFEYSYNTTTHTRMQLDKVIETSTSNQIIESYAFYYKSLDLTGFNLGVDNWGYHTVVPSCKTFNLDLPYEPSKEFSTLGILEKIKYKTKGSAVFDYEINHFSFVGNTIISDFKDNPENWENSNGISTQSFESNGQIFELPNFTQNTKVKFYPSIINDYNVDPQVTLSLQKFVNGQWKSFAGLFCSGSNANCCIELFLEPNVQYRIKRTSMPDYTGTASVGIEYQLRTPVEKKYLIGGGNRIKRIGYFDQEVPQDYYRSTNTLSVEPTKELNYSYIMPSEPSKSSGSHVFALPVFNYPTYMSIQTKCDAVAEISGIFEVETITSSNNHSFLRTQGSDIGYKYVSVSEAQKGSTSYEYSSPIDFPEEIIFSNCPPFLSSTNIDYKRGNLLKEIIKNNTNDILTEVSNTYSYDESLVKYGIRFHRPSGVGFQGQYFSTYTTYLQFLISQPGPIWGYNPGFYESFSSTNLPGYPANYINSYELFAAYGWAKLTSKTTRNYFYDQSNNQRIVETHETYQYNPVNKMIAESTVNNSLGETKTTKYFYHTGNSIYSQNRIAEIERIETYRGSELLSTSKINYSNNWNGNVSYLPQTIATSKGTLALENRVRYTKYDAFSHPLELQQENGTFVSYIWGYNKTQPIAKIENATNAQIEAVLGMSITAASEANLSSINALRTSLPSAMVTTFTYIPLVGVETITDPKGDTMRYEYDSFGRLKAVFDSEGNKLSENEYHYRTQN